MHVDGCQDYTFHIFQNTENGEQNDDRSVDDLLSFINGEIGGMLN